MRYTYVKQHDVKEIQNTNGDNAVRVAIYTAMWI